MNKIFIEITLKDYFVSLISDNKTIKFCHKKDFIKKSDFLVENIKKMSKEVNFEPKDIQEVYVTNGPGSFMGIRAGLMFARTFCFFTKSKLFYASTLNLISINKEKENVYIKTKNDEYYFKEKDKEGIKIIENWKEDVVDYEKIISNPNHHLKIFKEVSLDELNENYVKDLNLKENI